jgi:alpha-2-macroglobulin
MVLRAIFFVLFAFVLPLQASAFDLPEIEESSAAYLSLLKREYGGAEGASDALPVAIAMAGIGQWKPAAENYARAAAIDTENATVWLGLATALLNLNASDPHAADAAYRALLAAGNDDGRADALALIGASLEKRSKYRDAISAYSAGLEIRADAALGDHVADLVAQHGFRATGVQVNADSDRPEFCIEFRGKLGTGRSVRYDDFLRIEPAVSGSATVRGDALCVDGVKHGASHRVTVLAGLPSETGEITASVDNFDVEIGDRPASVGFRGNAYVLPRTGAAGIPVMTVNVDRVKLKILRVGERNLVPQLNQGRIPNQMAVWDIRQVGENEGETVWEGEMDVVSEPNIRITTAFPVGEILDRTKPGVYAAIAEPAGAELSDWGLRATQWLVISDIGLTTFDGADGLHVFVRSLETAKSKSGVTVKLFARNNILLAEAETDADGGVRFDPGLMKGTSGSAPKALFAAHDGDFNFLDLSGPVFDLSDRGVGGRQTPGPIDVFLYADRGVYRRGDTAHLVALMRDAAAMAIDRLPLNLRILRPDGVEAERRSVKADAPGAFAIDLPFSPGALTGRWTIEARIDPEAAPVGSLRVLVEDVVPPRIEVKLSSPAETLKPGETAQLAVQADYLYGAPASDLPAEGEVVILKDETPYPQWPGYAFGLVDETVKPKRQRLPLKRVGAAGDAAISLNLESLPDTTQPLKAVIRAGVFELGGRPATASLTLPVRTQGAAIGIKARFARGEVPEGSEAAFDVIALADGAGLSETALEYAFYREDWVYRWFRANGAWDYTVQVIDKPLSGGRLQTETTAPVELAQTVEWGRYRLEVFDPQTGAASSVRFRSGWFMAPTAASRPDSLELTADKNTYRPGELAKLHIRPPFDAEVLLTVANDGIVETRSVSVPKDGATIEIPFTDDWGVGAYVLATAFRPDSQARGPGRAIGLKWLGLDASPRTLDVAIEVPERTVPREKLVVPIKVGGVAPGEKAFVTLAAVDEGVLQLTGFQTPDPAAHYFGKRRLGVGMRDLYGRLIDGKTQRRGNVRSGGGDPRLANKGAPPVDVRIVSLFSGLVELDDQGAAQIPVEVPDFTGRLRLMAVAFSASRMGSGESALKVRDPLIAQVSLPRFLAPGDESRLTVSVNNLDGPAGDVSVRFQTDGGVAIVGADQISQRLEPGSGHVAAFDIKADRPGLAKIHMELEGPNGFALTRDWTLAVRPAQFRLTEHLAARLQPGEQTAYSQAVIDGFVPGTAEVLLGFSPRPDLDVPGLLRALDRYPYGCLEQTTSRALPLLYVADVAEVWGGKGVATGQKTRIRDAVRRVLEMQRGDGGFALWNPAGDAELWLSSYAVDFLIRARAAGFKVPDRSLGRALKWLEGKVKQAEWSDKPDLGATAYAIYDLAAAGVGKAAQARYFAERHIDKLPTAMASAQLAAALALHGEADMARTYFGKALTGIGKRPDLRDYGSKLRDLAGLVALAAETESLIGGVERDWGGRGLTALVSDLIERQTDAKYLSPQEQAWLIMAAAALGDGKEAMSLMIDGEAVADRTEPLYVRPGTARLSQGLAYENAGQAAIWHTATVSGIPAAVQPAFADGFALTRGFYSLDGEPVDVAKVKQNDLLVVVIEGESLTDLDHQALIVDLLPAGLELENARLDDARSARELGWLPSLSRTRHVEYRDDRFVAAFDIGGERRNFAVAYLARAVTPGRYALPAAHIEDMYKPRYRARTAMGELIVEANN